MSDEYDVIIIGSGRRRRHAGARPRPVGQADPPPRARRLAAARDGELGRRGGLRRQPLRLEGHLVRRRRQGVPARRSTTSSAAPPSSTARRSTGCASEDFGELRAPRRHLARLADQLRRHGAVLHEGRAAVPGARRPRRGPDRAALQRALPVPAALPRAAHPAALRRPAAGGLPPVPRAVRDHARRGEPAVQRLHPLRRPATASRAWCTPSPTRSRSACGRRSSTPT